MNVHYRRRHVHPVHEPESDDPITITQSAASGHK